LSETFLSDGQWFNQDGDISKRRRNNIQVLLLIDVVLRHEAVRHFDPALDEISGGAEILQVCPAGPAMVVRTRTADGGNDKIARFQMGNVGADFYNLT
jgi:hypothetical protein